MPKDDATKPDASKAATAANEPKPPAPKPGDEVLFWPARKPFIQFHFKASVVGVSNIAPTTVQLLVSNHETGRTFNVAACEYSAEPAPGCWGLPKKTAEG